MRDAEPGHSRDAGQEIPRDEGQVQTAAGVAGSMEPVFPFSSPGSACPFGRAPGEEGGAELAQPDPTEQALAQPHRTEKALALAQPDPSEKALSQPDPEEKALSQPHPAEQGTWQQQDNRNTDKPQHKAKS